MKYCWYLYMLLLMCLATGRMIERITADSGGFSSRYLPLIATVVIAIGLYGSINNRAIFRRWFWSAIYILSILLSSIAMVYAVYLGIVVGDSALTWAGLVVLMVILLLPAQVKLKQYCAKTAPYW